MQLDCKVEWEEYLNRCPVDCEGKDEGIREVCT